MENIDEVSAVLRELEEALKNNSLTTAAGKIQDYLKEINNVELNIAVTGETGSGKSTFVNAFRGMKNNEEGAALTGVVETTMEAKAYPHPKYPNLKVWDLPGIGTANFKPEEYLQKVEFDRFDFFIIVSSERFRANDITLAKEIQKMKKKFYFVRSKIDNDMRAEGRKEKFDQDKTLETIRQYCIKGLEDQGLGSPKVFLISSFDLGHYDFHDFEETIEKELPDHKRHVLLLSIPNITLQINQRKKEAFKANIWRLAFVSGFVAAIPIPGLSFAVDVSILVIEIKKYYNAFGLDDESLQRLANRMNVPVEELKAVLKSPLNKEINKDVVVKLLQSAVLAGVTVVEYLFSNIPIVGSLAAAGISFGTTYYMLRKCLNELADDAHNVLMKALANE
ncbi:interferon-inducible GTPase 5-like isoform X1 [Oncorhynchus keta]|uniref:interferon-inducible GTPase 5-like isoform X1 n=1 Tax=Oncorhynchus keta TaxID=8018 RepID=UPI0015F82CFD|nr:interferon-inducible GTPase 5-like isoform X1 [Oncorhynchus keta]